MRARLSSLGFAMALEPIPNLKKLDIHMIDDESNSPNHRTPASATTSRRTTINNDDTEMTHMSGALNPPEDPVSTRPAKRQRVASLEEMQEKSSTDRELMPPPRQTLSRKLSVRKIIPTLRRKFNVRTPRLSTDRSHEGEMYSDNREPITPHDSDSVVEHRRVIGASDDASFPIASQNTPLQAFQDPKSSRVTNVTNSNFTFRSPSANAIQSDYRSQARLPQERSYLRLMDGLSYNDGIELGLQDPRQNMTYDVQPSNGHIPSLISPELLQYDQPVREQSMWRSGFPHFRRKPIETSVPPHETFQRGAYVNTGHNSSQELEAGGTIMPVTPMRQGSLDRNPPMDSVVSSCAKHIYQMPSGYENHGVAEVRGSSTRSGGYQLHDPQTSNSRPRWEAPRGLNGLSFIDTPLDSQNRPIRYQDGFVTSSSPHYTPTSKTFDGHIVRREQHESPYFSRSTYQPSTHLSINDRQSHRHQLAAPTKSYSSFKSPALSRLSALPQASPLTLKARSQPQWHRLQRAGVRSSRQGFQTQISNSHGIVQARQHPSTGLRGARR